MLSTTQNFLEGKKEFWINIPALVDTIGRFSALNDEVQRSAQRQRTPTEGVTESKTIVRTELEDELMDVADPLGAHFAKTKNPMLGALVDFTISVTSQWTGQRLLEVAEKTLELGQAHRAVLVAAGMDENEIGQLEEVIGRFRKLETAPREASAEKGVQTEALPALVRAATAMLRDELDRLMNRFRRREPELFAGYKRARIILGRGQGTPDEKKAQAAPEAAATNAPAAPANPAAPTA